MVFAAWHLLGNWHHAKAEWKQSQQNSKPHDCVHFLFMMTMSVNCFGSTSLFSHGHLYMTEGRITL